MNENTNKREFSRPVSIFDSRFSLTEKGREFLKQNARASNRREKEKSVKVVISE